MRKYWEGSRVKVYWNSSRAGQYWEKMSPNQRTLALAALPGGAVTAPIHLLLRGGRAFFRYMNGSEDIQEIELPDLSRDTESDLKGLVDET